MGAEGTLSIISFEEIDEILGGSFKQIAVRNIDSHEV